MIINNAPTAQTQNNIDNPDSIPYGLNAPTKPNDMIATRTNPIISSNFAMIFYCNYVKSKRYMVL